MPDARKAGGFFTAKTPFRMTRAYGGEIVICCSGSTVDVYSRAAISNAPNAAAGGPQPGPCPIANHPCLFSQEWVVRQEDGFPSLRG